MKLSAQEEYGLRCLLQVAMHEMRGTAAGTDEPAQIALIATGEGLSPEYVAKLMRVLRQGGLVSSTRGAGGGYRLSRPAAEITVADVIEVLDGPLFRDSFCTDHPGQGALCVHSPTECSIRTLWRRIGTALDKVLRQITLEDLIGGPTHLSTALIGASPLFGTDAVVREKAP